MAVESQSSKSNFSCGDHDCAPEISERGIFAPLKRLDNYFFYLSLRIGDFNHWVKEYRKVNDPKQFIYKPGIRDAHFVVQYPSKIAQMAIRSSWRWLTNMPKIA